MDLLNKSIYTVSFDDVVEFCKQGIPEGLQLDYKQEKPSAKKLAKHIVALSNTYGGLIVIGVEEDKAKGVPRAWEGIEFDPQDIEWVSQVASSVAPLPLYEVAATDEKNEKVFLLVRVLEGPASPYSTYQDPTFWMRTGNISTALKGSDEPAGREDLIRLVRKSKEAHRVRHEQQQIIEKHFSGLVDGQKKIYEQGDAIYPLREESLASLASISIMPFSPTKLLFNPRDLYASRTATGELLGRNGTGLYSLALSATPIPNGLGIIRYGRSNGDLQALQFYSNGVLSYTEDIASPFKGLEEGKGIYISDLFRAALKAMNAAKRMYTETAYQGPVAGKVILSNIKGASVFRMSGGGHDFPEDNLMAMLENYTWEIDLNTTILSDELAYENYLIDLCEQMHWYLGDSGPGDDAIRQFIKREAHD